MNPYDHLRALILEANKLSLEDCGNLHLLRAELDDWLKRNGKIGSLALGLIAWHAWIKEEEKLEATNQAHA